MRRITLIRSLVLAVVTAGSLLLSEWGTLRADSVTWATKTAAPSARQALMVAAATNGKIYAIGGLNASSTALATVEITVNETIGVSDAVGVFPPVAVTVNESIGVSDAVGVFPPVAVTVNESIGVSDAVGVFPPVAVTVDESVGVSDAVGVIPPVAVTVDESIGVSDAVGVIPPVAVTVDESIVTTDGPLVKAQDGGKPLRPPPPRISGGAAMADQRPPAPKGLGQGRSQPAISAAAITAAAATEALAPALLFSVEGINFDENAVNTGFFSIPPDPIGAVGPTHLVSVVNSSIEWHTKAGVQENSQSLATFFTPVSPLTGTFDPKVIFDQYAGRFLVVTLERVSTTINPNAGNISRILLAVSKTSNPNGGWWFHAINAKTTITGAEYWADYPGFAVDAEAVYVTANLFRFVTNSFGGNRLWIVNKGLATGFYAGLGASQTVHDPATVTGGFDGTMQPAHMFGAAPAGLGTFLIMYDGLTTGGPTGNEALQVIRVDNPVTAPAFNLQTVFVGNIENVGGAFGWPALPDAPQLGTATGIEVNDRRALNAVWRNNQLYVVAEIIPNSGVDLGQTTAHWWRLNTTALSAISSADQGNVGGEDIAAGTYTFFPSVAVDSLGNMAVGFSASAPTIFPGAYYTARLAADPPGTVQASGVVRAGLDFYVRTFGGTRNRWGDYSGASVDPSDGTTMCVFNEYARIRGTILGGEDGRWGTAFGCFSLAPPPAGTVLINGGAAFANSTSATLTLTCSDGTGSGCTQMQVATDGAADNEAFEAFAPGKAVTLPSGDGTKTVAVKFKDAAGNVSAQFTDTIVLDTTAPTGTVLINGGAAFANSTSATLTLTCSDGTGAGCTQMQVATDGVADTEPFEAFATTKAVTLPSGDGTKTVAVKFNDAAGNLSGQFTDTIVLDATVLAQTDLKAAQDVADPALPTGVKATIDQITTTAGASVTGVLIASYEANITFLSTLAQATACRLRPPINAAPSDCTISAGQVHLKATHPVSGSGVATPIDPLAFVALRLLGSNNPTIGNTTVNLNFVEIRDSLGSVILQVSPPDTRTFLRGDALADGSISIGDVLYIGQHLVNPATRPAGEGPGKVNLVNAGSVNHDAPIDVITVADAVKIAQFLVGNVNGFYLGSAAPLTLQAGQIVATDTVPPSTSTSQVPEPNVNGWNRTNVSVTLTATDPSGPAQPGQTTLVSGVKEIRHRVNGGSVVVTAGASTQIVLEAAGVHTITYFAVDNAGNQEGAKTLTVRIDKTPPQVTKTLSPAPVDGWVDNDGNPVTATWSGTDDLSGVASCDPPTVLATGGIHTVAGNCTDKAGNQGSHSQIVKVVTKVPIDIRPGFDPNFINPRSRGNIPVGVKSGPTHGVAFDATAINRATVIFAGAPALSIDQSPQDFDSDGDLDMVYHFETPRLDLTASSTQACLKGETTAGLRFKGCDTVRMVASN